MTNLFQGKTGAEIARAMGELTSAEQTRAQFAALAALPAETRDVVVDALEKDLLQLTGTFRSYIDDMGMAPAKSAWINTKAPDTQAAIREEQALAEIVQQLAVLKGNAADPLVTAAAQEIAKLTPAQTGTENAVYGAIFDAIEKVMIASGIMPKAEENERLEKIHDAFGWRMSVAVKEHFNAAGKFQQFAQAPTEAENEQQRNALRGLLTKSDEEATLGYLKATDVFMSVARRVGSDADLAALLPKNNFDATDVEVLEKHKLPSLAALVKTSIQNKPK
ncbi:MAG: hypothetical protein JNM12_15750 [Alphaproteobacteria bacterium]|nr:hypothetical protein [Alphaproteobacteria bacterium]